MKNAFKLNGDIEITMTPQSQNWKHLMELVKDGDVFTVTKANNTVDVVFKRTGQTSQTELKRQHYSEASEVPTGTLDKTPREG